MNHIDIIEIRNAIEGIIDLADINAKAVRAYYNALIKQGFTRVEALRIVEKHGYQPPIQGLKGD